MDKKEFQKKILCSRKLKQYKILSLIGSGSFGSVFKASKGENIYAIKFESRSNRKQILEHEAKLMHFLQHSNLKINKTYSWNSKSVRI